MPQEAGRHAHSDSAAGTSCGAIDANTATASAAFDAGPDTATAASRANRR